jgi:hypothetical protein
VTDPTEPDVADAVQMIPVPIAALYVNCSFPMRADAIAASDTCQRFAKSGVVDPETGNTYWRCDQHEGMVRTRPDYTPAVLLGRVVTEVLRAPSQEVITLRPRPTEPKRQPYVGTGADGCQRSAEIDRNEIDTLPTGPHQEGWSEATEERRSALLASAARWEEQARLEALEERFVANADLPRVITTIGPEHDGTQATVYGSRPFPFLTPGEIEQRSVTAETVTVDLADLRRYLAEMGTSHAHEVPGVWDPDNRPGVRGEPCTLCPTYDRLLAAVGGRAALPPRARP